MNILILKSLHLDNFAGSGKEDHTFFERVTTVSASNGVGKTRLERSFKWLLFDKNEEDKKDFAIKNTKNTELNRQEHIVSAVINVNGSDISLKKIYKENWVKKQGSKTQEFSGNKTEYFFNEVPVQKAEYNAKVSALIDEEVFKLLTSISAFNKMPWLKQRSTILSLVPEVTDNDVASQSTNFQQLLASLNNGKTLAEYKTQLAAQKKKLNDQLKAIPVRIDEIRKGMPEVYDFDALQIEINEKLAQIKTIEDAITNGQEQFNKLNEGRQAKLKVVNDLKLKKQSLEFELQQANSKKENEIANKKRECRDNISNDEKEIANLTKKSQDLIDKIPAIDVQLDALRDLWVKINAEEITFGEDDSNFKCPTCGTANSADDIEAKKEELKSAFNTNKVNRLQTINTDGAKLKKEQEGLRQELAEANQDYDNAVTSLEGFKAEFLRLAKEGYAPGEIKKDASIVEIENQITAAEANIETVEPVDQTELKEQKNTLSKDIDGLKLWLNNKTLISNIETRITELKQQEEKFAQEVCDMEGTEFTIAEFDKAKINAVEAPINAKFEKVKFKLFENQVNGAEVPMCEATYLDVPYSDLSTAQKIIAGLDIIKTLSDHYQIYAPVFLDNAEAITEIPEMKSQVIKLEVMAGQKTLLFS